MVFLVFYNAREENLSCYITYGTSPTQNPLEILLLIDIAITVTITKQFPIFQLKIWIQNIALYYRSITWPGINDFLIHTFVHVHRYLHDGRYVKPKPDIRACTQSTLLQCSCTNFGWTIFGSIAWFHKKIILKLFIHLKMKMNVLT